MRYIEGNHTIVSKTWTGNHNLVAAVTFVLSVNEEIREFAVYAGGDRSMHSTEEESTRVVKDWGAKLPEAWARAIFATELQNPDWADLEWRE